MRRTGRAAGISYKKQSCAVGYTYWTSLSLLQHIAGARLRVSTTYPHVVNRHEKVTDLQLLTRCLKVKGGKYASRDNITTGTDHDVNTDTSHGSCVGWSILRWQIQLSRI